MKASTQFATRINTTKTVKTGNCHRSGKTATIKNFIHIDTNTNRYFRCKYIA